LTGKTLNDQSDTNKMEDARGGAEPLEYCAPTVDVRPIRLITQGGSPGAGDSGDTQNFQVAG
jgi:hypothetical protein